jgi:hypothetical protein
LTIESDDQDQDQDDRQGLEDQDDLTIEWVVSVVFILVKTLKFDNNLTL